MGGGGVAEGPGAVRENAPLKNSEGNHREAEGEPNFKHPHVPGTGAADAPASTSPIGMLVG